ncbi:TRPT1 [Mytilus coruscus]|uniref:2'-phosphotransferase n=1 Tax=Mytilus coruscus TaxID=42192 RepID=A0A6J8BY96_MYTCO|nr:TRPT1 [Mytilus coruscus]
MSGRYKDHLEAYHEYQVPNERATMAPERAPANAWKVELEKTDRKFVLVHEKLDEIMDQFKKLLPCPVARSPSPDGQAATPSGGLDCYLLKSLANILRHGALELGNRLLPGGYLLVEEILKRHLGFAGYSLSDIHKLIEVDVNKMFTLIRDTDSGCWKIRANQGHSLVVDTPDIPLLEKHEELDFTVLTADQEGPVANIVRKPIGAILALEESHSHHEVAAPREKTMASDEEAQESWDSTSDVDEYTTLVEEASDTVCQPYQGSMCPTPVVDGGMTDNYGKGHTSLTLVDPSSTGAIDRKATTENNSAIYKEAVIIVESFFDKESSSINPERPSLSLGSLFKADNIGTRYFNLQSPPIDSGTTVLHVTMATIRWGPNRRPWNSLCGIGCPIEKSDKKFDKKLEQVHEKLNDMMDQFKKLLARPAARSPSPGGRPGPGECYHCAFQTGMPKDTGSVNHLVPECPLEAKGTVSSDSEEEVAQDWGVDRRLSKTLAYVLRRGAGRFGHQFLPGGFVYVDELLGRHPGLSGYTLKELTRLVEADVVKRFTLERDLENGWWKIKANQGHSIDVGSFGMPSVEENTVAVAYHYTTMLAWGDIVDEGLRRMSRQHSLIE